MLTKDECKGFESSHDSLDHSVRSNVSTARIQVSQRLARRL